MAKIERIGSKRKKGGFGEYPVKFSHGEVLYLPPRRMRQRPAFENGKLATIGVADEIMTEELEKMCTELISVSDGSTEITGRALELLVSIAAYLILQVYDADDVDLAAALEIKFGTSEFDNISEQWPSRIYRWVIGGDEITEILANHAVQAGGQQTVDHRRTGDG